MTKKQINIAEALFEKAKKLSFGSVSVELKIHAGKCVGIIYVISENTRQTEKSDDILD